MQKLGNDHEDKHLPWIIEHGAIVAYDGQYAVFVHCKSKRSRKITATCF